MQGGLIADDAGQQAVASLVGDGEFIEPALPARVELTLDENLVKSGLLAVWMKHGAIILSPNGSVITK
jgi:hypothetical protein